MCIRDSTRTDYYRKCRDLDLQYHNIPHGTSGPVRLLLDSYGGVFPLCFGRLGEVNDLVLDILKCCATFKARRVARRQPLSAFDRNMDIRIPELIRRFNETYKRALSTFSASHKARLIINRKALIGLNPNQQNNVRYGEPSDHVPFSSFGRNRFGPEKGSHFFPGPPRNHD